MTNVAVIYYYSATGNVHALAQAMARGCERAGGTVRLRRAGELAPAAAIDFDPPAVRTSMPPRTYPK